MSSTTHLEQPAKSIAHTLSPRSGTSFPLSRGETLTVIDPEGQQVSDLLCFSRSDPREVISNGRTLDYASKIYLSTGDLLYSNRSNVMLRIVEDTCGKNDFLLTPCSKEMFRIIYGHDQPHRGCFGNLVEALHGWGIARDAVPVAFNCFMNVPVDGTTGEIKVLTPTSKAGDFIKFVAEMDVIIAMTACSAGQSNGGTFKPIQYRLDGL